MIRSVLFAAVVVLMIASSTLAAPTTFNLLFTGAQEVPNPQPGDPDGTASGTITFDPDAASSPVYGEISWNVSYSNIDGSLNGFHIHTGTFGTEGGIIIGLGTQTSGGAGTLIHTYRDSNWNMEWDKDEINQSLANPEGFYLNIHSTSFPDGAVRAQLPEPASLGLLLVGAMAFLRRRRR